MQQNNAHSIHMTLLAAVSADQLRPDVGSPPLTNTQSRGHIIYTTAMGSGTIAECVFSRPCFVCLLLYRHQSKSGRLFLL